MAVITASDQDLLHLRRSVDLVSLFRVGAYAGDGDELNCDEGGEPDKGIGGHDQMWFVARDMAFGADAFPDVDPPENIARPEVGRRFMAEIAPEHEGMLSFLMNLLMIEVRAERAFDFYVRVISNTETFPDKAKEATHAVELVNRIRQDESVHVAWLRAAISEFRSFTIKTVDGGHVPGASIVDPVWESMVHWHAVEMHEKTRPVNRAAVRDAILASDDGPAVLKAFESLPA